MSVRGQIVGNAAVSRAVSLHPRTLQPSPAEDHSTVRPSISPRMELDAQARRRQSILWSSISWSACGSTGFMLKNEPFSVTVSACYGKIEKKKESQIVVLYPKY